MYRQFAFFCNYVHFAAQANDYEDFVIGIENIKDEKNIIQDKITRLSDNGL